MYVFEFLYVVCLLIEFICIFDWYLLMFINFENVCIWLALLYFFAFDFLIKFSEIFGLVLVLVDVFA